MRFLIFTVFVVFACGTLPAQTNGWQPTPGHTQIRIWPKQPPDAQPVKGPEVANMSDGLIVGKPVLVVSNVSQPTMTVYSPKEKNTGAAVLIFPGGGYQVLAIDLEGTEVCDWLNSRGITGVVLKYRVPNKRTGPYGEALPALQDAQRALSLTRFHAAEWHIDPRKVGVIGFSAGGHMVPAVSTHFDKRAYAPVDAADKESCRPDFGMAMYPGHLWSGDEGFKLNPNVTVTSNTPPQFIVQAENDDVDNVNNSLVYYIALKDKKVPAEIHLYAGGKHAYGLRHTEFPITDWPRLAERWLRTIGMVSE